ncbi:hypothetical protein P7K49_018117 [Saguinus oedipus]|uniref:Uncharacterized protein n=1 Tax=Saguinus oedipus TaxID=9490 RepID=A0ABQ9V4H4_SAGOE|nr:hypothetical protein P7K49_018117 [Saguinus oedipus]
MKTGKNSVANKSRRSGGGAGAQALGRWRQRGPRAAAAHQVRAVPGCAFFRVEPKPLQVVPSPRTSGKEALAAVNPSVGVRRSQRSGAPGAPRGRSRPPGPSRPPRPQAAPKSGCEGVPEGLATLG